jgi:hypothetical protein
VVAKSRQNEALTVDEDLQDNFNYHEELQDKPSPVIYYVSISVSKTYIAPYSFMTH